jgi:flagellar basal body rod protein FlgG
MPHRPNEALSNWHRRREFEMAETSTEQISASLDALVQEFYTITHNLANVGTAGFKRRCNAFSKAMEAQGPISDNYSPGSIDLNSVLDFSQGNIVETGRPLDFAVHGSGFFVIETPDGPLYTRNGIFFTNQNGQIVDSEGRIVAGQGGPITVPAGVALSQLSASSDGSIRAGETTIGRFNLVDFGENEHKLTSVGASCFQMPDPEVVPVEADNVVLKQGYHEASNVKLVDELVDMIMVSRLYEANMKLLSAQTEASTSIMNVALG